MIELYSEKGISVELGDVPAALKHDLSFISRRSTVHSNTINIRDYEDNFIVSFSVERELCGETHCDAVLSTEPISLRYSKSDLGTKAPSIHSGRSDFPRELPHLNPIEEHQPAHFCINRLGTQVVYDSEGINGVLNRLDNWLSDAASGNLEPDGWEPIPRSSENFIDINIGGFQELIFKSKDKGILYGECFAAIFGKNNEEKIYLSMPEDFGIKQNFKNELKNKNIPGINSPCFSGFPWVCMWETSLPVCGDRFGLVLNSFDNLKKYIHHAGLEEKFSSFMSETLKRAGFGESGFFALFIAQSRPKTLTDAIPSDADGEAKKIEIVSLVVKVGASNSKVEVVSVSQCGQLARVSQKLLSDISDVALKFKKSLPIIGVGTLGSKIAVQLCRQGIERLMLVDDDILSPHNIARHELGQGDLYRNKAESLKGELERKFPVIVRASKVKLENMAQADLDKVMESPLVLDASADKAVMRRLVSNKNFPRVCRAVLTHKGNLGLLYKEGALRNPRLDDLEVLSYGLASECEVLTEWLNDESQGQVMLVGASCSGSSLKLSDAKVSIHVGNFMPVISDMLSGDEKFESGIFVNACNDRGFSRKTIFYKVPEFNIYSATEAGVSWEIRIHPDVIVSINEATKRGAANEAGGYLYGRYDFHTKVCVVVDVKNPVPMQATPTSLELPPAMQSTEELALMEKTNGKLIVLGSWHSHPGGHNAKSDKDIQQLKRSALLNDETPRPFLMLINGTNGIGASIALPAAWK